MNGPASSTASIAEQKRKSRLLDRDSACTWLERSRWHTAVTSNWTGPRELPEARRSVLRYRYQTAHSTMTRKFNVLVVDDDLPLRSVLRTSLSARGFAVEEASSAEQALEVIPQRTFDIVLLDINMPGMGGLEACHRIRALTPHLGIVMVTVRDAERDIVRALDAGADDYITKPFKFGELVARLRAVLRRRDSGGVPAALQAGDLEIDFERRLLRRAGKLVHLTPTEFDLLALLMRNQGMPLTHAKLLSAIWGPEYREDLEYLRSYVRALRKKIEEDPSRPRYILTEPWLGYRFSNPSGDEAIDSEQ